jgi:hypothetical protein
MVRWRTIFFAINFAAAIFVAIMCVVSAGEALVGGGSPFAFLGGVGLVGPAIAFGVAEWVLYVRSNRTLELPLGIVCGLIGGFAVFAFAANAAEAAVKGGTPGAKFWIPFGTACFGIAVYSLWCGWLRVRGRTFPEMRGFPVVGPTGG